MNPQQQRNALRMRAVHLSRAMKSLFARAEPRPRAGWRRLFMAEDDAALRRVAEICLADLRDYCFAQKSAFDPDPIVMARREGRREVWLRIINSLHLDEQVVRQLMETDDGY